MKGKQIYLTDKQSEFLWVLLNNLEVDDEEIETIEQIIEKLKY